MSDKAYRTEHDSMGELKVPKDALWGAQTQRAVENFPISGIPMPRQFVAALGLVKWAAAGANSELGLLKSEFAVAIQNASLQVIEGQYDEHFPIDVFQTGSGTSSNMNANEVIAHLATESMGDVLENKADEVRDIVKTGRTHLMDAMPITLGQELDGWRAQIDHGIERLNDTMKRLSALAQGGTAVGTGINAHPKFGGKVAVLLSEKAGVEFTSAESKFEALSCQDAAVEASGQLRVLAVSLTKISNDLRWMNAGPLAGIGEIALPALQPGSSIMPGKVNPVIPEAVAMVAAQVIGNDATITIAGQSGNFQLNVMLPVVTLNLLQSIELLANASTCLADKAIAGFTVNQDKINEALHRNPILVTAYAEGRSVKDVAKEMTDLTDEELDRLLDPAALTEGGIKN